MDKGEIKAATVHELGVKFDDMLDASRRDVDRNEGAKLAMLGAAKKVGDLAVHVDKDMDEGVFSNLDGPLAVAKVVKKYITRACGVLESGYQAAENHRLVAHGKVLAFEQMVGNMKKIHDQEMEKVRQRLEVATSEPSADVRSRLVGMAPARTLKEQRQGMQEEASAPEPVPVQVVPSIPIRKSAPKKTVKRTAKKR